MVLNLTKLWPYNKLLSCNILVVLEMCVMRVFFLNGILIWCDYVRVGQFKYSRHLGNIPVYFILFYFSTQNTENRNIAKSVLYIIVQTKKEKKKKSLIIPFTCCLLMLIHSPLSYKFPFEPFFFKSWDWGVWELHISRHWRQSRPLKKMVPQQVFKMELPLFTPQRKPGYMTSEVIPL